MKRLATAAMLATLALAPAFGADAKADTSNPLRTGVYLTAGTGGAGLGLVQGLNDHFGLRGEYTTYTLKRTLDDSDITYKGDIKLQTAALYADYRPFKGVFRLTGGVTFQSPKGTLDGQFINGKIDINGTTYTIPNGSAKAEVKYPSVMPYLGLGWGYRGTGKSGILVGFDLGAFIGKPKATVTYSQEVISAAKPADLAAEQKKFQDSVEKVNFYPIVKLGVGYSF